jgi:hypothetical protein
MIIRLILLISIFVLRSNASPIDDIEAIRNNFPERIAADSRGQTLDDGKGKNITLKYLARIASTIKIKSKAEAQQLLIYARDENHWIRHIAIKTILVYVYGPDVIPESDNEAVIFDARQPEFQFLIRDCISRLNLKKE